MIGSEPTSSQAVEYSVSKLNRVTSPKSAPGNSRVCVKASHRASPHLPAGFHAGRLAAADVHQDQRVQEDVRLDADLVSGRLTLHPS